MSGTFSARGRRVPELTLRVGRKVFRGDGGTGFGGVEVESGPASEACPNEVDEKTIVRGDLFAGFVGGVVGVELRCITDQALVLVVAS